MHQGLMMKRPPCIRNIEKFKKSGCPQQEWDGEYGCPAWKRLIVATKGDPLQKEVKEQCIDLWSFEFAWAGLGTLEGIQLVAEQNRNTSAYIALTAIGQMSPEQLAAKISPTPKEIENK